MCTHKMYRIYKLIWLQVYIGGHGGLLCPSPQLHSEVLHGALKNYFVPSTPKCLFASVGQGETQALIFIRNQLFTNEFFQQNIEHLLHTRYNVRWFAGVNSLRIGSCLARYRSQAESGAEKACMVLLNFDNSEGGTPSSPWSRAGGSFGYWKKVGRRWPNVRGWMEETERPPQGARWWVRFREMKWLARVL